MQLSEDFYRHRRLETLVENQTTFHAQQAELNIYETHQQAQRVRLRFAQPVLTSMLRGKKVMHLNAMDPFDYLAGSSVLLPAGEEMQIDFPEASLRNPTQCLALAISPDKVQETVSIANESLLRAQEEGDWEFTDQNFYFLNDTTVQALLQRIIGIFTEGNRARDMFVDFCLKELLIRLMQTHARHLLIGQAGQLADRYRMAHVVRYIRRHLDRPLPVEQLAAEACMSASHFHRCFKDTFGLTPNAFVLRERIKRATWLLRSTQLSVSQVALECGFRQLSYFTRCFRKATGQPPSRFRKAG